MLIKLLMFVIIVLVDKSMESWWISVVDPGGSKQWVLVDPGCGPMWIFRKILEVDPGGSMKWILVE